MQHSGAGKRILVAAIYPPGHRRFRFEQYIDHLATNGFSADLIPAVREQDYATIYAPGHFGAKAAITLRGLIRRAADAARLRKYDIVFVQREAVQLGTAAFELIAARSRAKLVFDLDDAIWLPNVSAANERFAWLKRPQKTEKIVAASDLIIAGNSYLASYARRFNERVEVVPTTVDTDLYTPPPPRSSAPVCIGWSGSLTTIEHFDLAIPVLRRVRDHFGDRVRFKVVGDPNFRVDDLGIAGVAWRRETEVEDLSDIDIGIMPMPDDEWSKGKCGFKGIQYMALAIPTVMSPVGMNAEIIDHGRNGFLASSEDEWVARLTELVESPELRARLGSAGRQTVVSRYSVASQRDRYVELFNGLLSNGSG
jgi:glycosyltransferase involved in cell wall biosynthesis